MLRNHGANCQLIESSESFVLAGFVVCSDSIEEALHLAYHSIIAIETQVNILLTKRKH